MSMTNPFPDIEINIRGTAVLMEACKKFNQKAVVIRTGTRGQYGPSTKLPVDENAPTMPRGIYEISNLAAEKIMDVYHNSFNIRCVLLRLTNIYGQRAQMKTDHYGVANWFIRQALNGEVIKVFGDGQLKRDFLYIDDCVDALLLCAINEHAYGEILNVGIDIPTTFLELVKIIIDEAGSGAWQLAPFTPERKAQEPGDFYSDIKKIRTLLGWQPVVSLREGVRKTVEYYKKYKQYYW
jgi:UDP-glucose 4-epimerase